MSYTGNCLTPKRAIICIDDVQPVCPPPPHASPKFTEILVPEQGRLSDAPVGFFLAAPCKRSSCVTTEIKLLPKKSRMLSRKDHVRLQPKRKATTTTPSEIFEDAYQGLTARTA
mmetsp:Transcript_2179/g.3585  ORF Transcript_2179/g.3585 Transcript_2179/m.3585 type:complete len:114 (-) Transcript_2179:341-682(-)